ncbi:DUF2637 domain-containing protein [Streptomyces sp. NPDC087422]|uniref:DUF2637 domain-containing protein n=1 Tax=Streptomyces sp. NPDC087422 TaxID=3365786 RepID=UPI003817FFA2
MTSPDAQRTPRTQHVLVGIVAVGAAVIAGIGFTGSYAAVRRLARQQGFGWFSNVFPIGIDAGIVVLLALDMLLTWKRIPFPLLRQTAWLLTAATVAFNAAASWPRPLGVAMHASIPVLFIVTVEAGRHAVGRLADITADRHIEPVRLSRWVLAPWPTFRLWRRMKLWEIRTYGEAIRREQDRLVYRVRLRARYGRAWRTAAPVETRIPLRLSRYGIPIGALGATADGASEAPQPMPATVPAPPPMGATGDATEHAPMAPRTRHEAPATNAPVAPQPDATGHVRGAATKAPRAALRKKSAPGSREAAKEAIRSLYGSLGTRPLESQMIAELIRIKSRYTSRQYANKLRTEIEEDDPKLAALGSENVRPLTGTDG